MNTSSSAILCGGALYIDLYYNTADLTIVVVAVLWSKEGPALYSCGLFFTLATANYREI